MQLLLGWLLKKIGMSTFIIAIEVVRWAVIITAYVFILSTLVDLYNLISSFLELASGSGASSDSTGILIKFFGLLNCVGFIPAFNAVKPAIFSAITFVLLKILYKESINVKTLAIKSIHRLI